MRSEASKARARAYQKERRERMKAQGLCPICGKPTNNGKVKCDKCLERTRVDTAMSGMEYIVKKPKKIDKNVKSIDEIALEARKAGMSYGKYVALIEYKKS